MRKSKEYFLLNAFRFLQRTTKNIPYLLIYGEYEDEDEEDEILNEYHGDYFVSSLWWYMIKRETIELKNFVFIDEKEKEDFIKCCDSFSDDNLTNYMNSSWRSRWLQEI